MTRLLELLGPGLLDSPWLTRLGGIGFLGTLDEHPRSRRASTRLEHSLGVAKLAADAATTLELPPGRARLFVAAGLLHDVGHYPLSHAAEPAFAKLFGASHHELGRWTAAALGIVAGGALITAAGIVSVGRISTVAINEGSSSRPSMPSTWPSRRAPAPPRSCTSSTARRSSTLRSPRWRRRSVS